ncbi:penicillin-binding protein 1A [Pseudazoarcus pumilus]|uniref:Penicillin-binding protein 1A n=1 Tax=Pseudazoarcus pumilus TaxID=2067960 RepID=A0A2I6S2X4_9RHOO|nr:penicillin-binding protein 1A [Pseudazoarcus pumilus]AUN93578.1 penicillin-binding protein [Pseudazoarcus pumilus]
MRWFLYLVAAAFVAIILAAASLGTIVAFAWPKLPSLEALTDYRPRIPLRIFSSDGHLLGEFGDERRAVVQIEEVPESLKQAILAAEDERFYEHPGVDPIGIARAAVANIVSGGRGQGASTITMQVARNFYLTREKTYNRKLYEILLAFKIERSLTKDKILELYINQIFLGHRAYGFATAAQTYFGKPIDEITLAEAAMLAGLPKAPSAYNPITNLHRATIRQHYVLGRMRDAGFIDDATLEAAKNAPITIASSRRSRRDVDGDYISEMARQIAVEQFGEDAYELGLRIITTVRLEEQHAAQEVLRDGILAYDRRHGYRGPEAFADLSGVDDADDERLGDALLDYRDHQGLLPALVLSASPKEVRVFRNGEIITITGKGLSFVAPMLDQRAPQTRRIRRGAIVRIQETGDESWEIVQLPEVEAALIGIDAQTGAVRALVGGFDFHRNKYNHVTQAYRQPGSSFKPFIYSAALERGFSPATYELDEPLFFPAEITGSKAWEPKNYDGKFDGPITLREALARSRNMVSIRVLQAITPEYAQDYIGRFGFEPARHPSFLTMALGAGSATPWQMAAAYAVFANGGFRVEPYIVQEITDANGRTLARFDPPVAGRNAPRVLDPRNAWLIDSMLQEVIRNGTGQRAKTLGRDDLAGKTGTTNDYVDAWFAGYNPDVVAVSWMGYSQPKNLGRGEGGARTALPVWIDYMRVALDGVAEKPRIRPPGLVPVRHADSDYTDFHYAEYPPPQAPPREIAEIPTLQYLTDDSAWQAPPETPEVEGEASRVPLSIRDLFQSRDDGPAPTEDSVPQSIRDIFGSGPGPEPQDPPPGTRNGQTPAEVREIIFPPRDR